MRALKLWSKTFLDEGLRSTEKGGYSPLAMILKKDEFGELQRLELFRRVDAKGKTRLVTNLSHIDRIHVASARSALPLRPHTHCGKPLTLTMDLLL